MEYIFTNKDILNLILSYLPFTFQIKSRYINHLWKNIIDNNINPNSLNIYLDYDNIFHITIINTIKMTITLNVFPSGDYLLDFDTFISNISNNINSKLIINDPHNIFEFNNDHFIFITSSYYNFSLIIPRKFIYDILKFIFQFRKHYYKILY